MEDHIRALWVKVAKTFEPYMDQIREQIDTEEQAERTREKEQILGIAYHKKADEDFQKLIATLMEEVKGK
ncbi:hypothetical protein Clacol_004716 [Clathrus columnatus]|uniref:Uncharacterized protein n=1 Tax=Clathrus columnatus TaxID=1419009 RepID=A0AAV5AC45_9AGAM|nr:hypothetical protein Clacol_004716 [Clathrus columnatus]